MGRWSFSPPPRAPRDAGAPCVPLDHCVGAAWGVQLLLVEAEEAIAVERVLAQRVRVPGRVGPAEQVRWYSVPSPAPPGAGPPSELLLRPDADHEQVGVAHQHGWSLGSDAVPLQLSFRDTEQVLLHVGAIQSFEVLARELRYQGTPKCAASARASVVLPLLSGPVMAIRCMALG